MKSDIINPSRREFVGALTLGATGILASVPGIGHASAPEIGGGNVSEAEEWFKKVKGKHRIVYDATEPHDGFPILWSWVFYKTNNQTGTMDNDLTAVIILRHNAIPFGMEDGLWTKYKFGERFHVNDPATGSAALKNPFYVPDNPMWNSLGIEGIKRLQERGVMVCVCDMAMTVYSSFAAKDLNLKPEEVKAEWVKGLLPGIQLVPSGVWAVGRAQEKGCAYCYAGG
jgi:intracellular sulfur oxidation DsrE/DsrF family protein